MKAFLSLLFIALTAGLAGCSSGTKTAPPATPTSASAGGATAGDDSLERIKKAGVLRWGADADSGAPFVYKENDKILGFEMELMEKFCKRMGVKSEMVQAKWDFLLKALESKRVDVVVNGLEINAERKKNFAFSAPYYKYEQQLTVRLADKEQFKSLDDLKGKKIGTLRDAEANNVLRRAGFADEQLVQMDDSKQPYVDLENKRTSAVVQENIIAAFYAGDDAKLYNIPKTFAPGEYGVVVRPADAALLKECDRVLAEMKASGELAEIYKKWKMWNETQKTIGIEEKK